MGKVVESGHLPAPIGPSVALLAFGCEEGTRNILTCTPGNLTIHYNKATGIAWKGREGELERRVSEKWVQGSGRREGGSRSGERVRELSGWVTV